MPLAKFTMRIIRWIAVAVGERVPTSAASATPFQSRGCLTCPSLTTHVQFKPQDCDDKARKAKPGVYYL